MKTNKQLLKDALNNGTVLTFIRGGQKETDAKIISLNSDDVINKDFIFETNQGQRFNGFENNITIVS